MPLSTRSKEPVHIRVLRLVLSGLMGALLVVSKQAMSGLPNIEPVTLLVILFALELPRENAGGCYGVHPAAGCAVRLWAVVGHVPVCLVSAGPAGMVAAPDGQCPWLGGVQRHLRPVLRRPVCGGVSGGKNTGLCPELVAQRPFLRCHARRGKFCHHAAALPPLRRALQMAKRQIHLD